MNIDEKAVWQRVTAASGGETAFPGSLDRAMAEGTALLGAISALSTGKSPYPELLRGQREALRTLRGLGRNLGAEGNADGKRSPFRSRTYRERLRELLEGQERFTQTLLELEQQLSGFSAGAVAAEAEASERRWRLLLMELGK